MENSAWSTCKCGFQQTQPHIQPDSHSDHVVLKVNDLSTLVFNAQINLDPFIPLSMESIFLGAYS